MIHNVFILSDATSNRQSVCMRYFSVSYIFITMLVP